MIKLNGNEVLDFTPHKNAKSVTLEEFVYGIVTIYEDIVYCEGFRNKKEQLKFEQKAYEFVVGCLNAKIGK